MATKKKHTIFSILYLFLLCAVVFTTQIHATPTAFAQETQEAATTEDLQSAQDIEKDFAVKMDTTYTVSREGVTTVAHEVTITNKTPAVYLRQYAFSTNYKKMSDIRVTSDGKPLPANITTTSEGTNIGITFADQLVGQGKSRNFTISYTSTELASVAGPVLELHIPKTADAAQLSNNTITVFTPVYFSKPVRVTAQPDSIEFVDSQTKMIWKTPPAETISALFGTEQLYQLSLRYHLENSSSSPILTQISLPPDTQFQKMHIDSLEPPPEEIKADVDGNWIATYRVPAASVTVVHLLTKARITLEPNTAVPATQPSPEHLKAKKYWEVTDSLIQEKAAQFNTPQAIYAHLIDTLEYPEAESINLNMLERRGAVGSFAQPEIAVCQEYSDAFVALARSAGFPARRLIGYAYNQDSTLRPVGFVGDILHSWPEYFDTTTQIWRQIDPTWGDTTGGVDYFTQFDLNHIVFAINGHSSTLPNPAGSYKLAAQDSEDIEVSLATDFPIKQPRVSAQLTPKKVFFIPIPGMYTLTLINETGQAWYNIETEVRSTDSELSEVIYSNQAKLVPFQKQKLDIQLYQVSAPLPKQRQVILEVQHADATITTHEYTITTGPAYFAYLQDQTTQIYLGAGVVCLTLIAGSLLVYRRKRNRFIRR